MGIVASSSSKHDVRALAPNARLERADPLLPSLLADLPPELLNMVLQRVMDVRTLCRLERTCRLLYHVSHGSAPSPVYANPWLVLCRPLRCQQSASTKHEVLSSATALEPSLRAAYEAHVELKALRKRLAGGSMPEAPSSLGRVRAGLFQISGARESNVLILMVGLDAAGKTTLAEKLKLGAMTVTVPTIGFNVESVELSGSFLTLWDVGGPDKIRPLWRHYFQDTFALIFVVDSNDRERIPEAKRELEKMMDDLVARPLLVFANKQDLPKALSAAELASALDLHGVRDRPWHIEGCSAKSGHGLLPGLVWLHETIRSTMF